MHLDNQTPFQLAHTVLLDKQAAEFLIVASKATYSISENGKLVVAAPQEVIRAADEFYGEPGQSSIRHEAELGTPKLATDVALIGSAVAPQPGTTSMDVGLRVGPVSKLVKVFGERRWQKSLIGFSISRPKPFDRVPLVYEHAYGGTDLSAKNPKDHANEPRNPVGRGFRSGKSELQFADTLLPQIEDPENLLKRPGGGVSPQGFGFLGRDWEPRARFLGTYDQKWQDERMPLLPQDFDDRHYSAAHPDLTARGYLKRGVPVEIIGCTRGGRVLFTLPDIEPIVTVCFGTIHQAVGMYLNTVLINTDAMKLTLLWKGGLNVHRRLRQISRIEARLTSERT
jgi:hypothetical protein